MRKVQIAGPVSVLLAGVLMSGCGGSEDALSSAAPRDDHPPEGAVQVSATCDAISDVLTIVDNADTGVVDGRMQAQEQNGWYALATRALGRVPHSTDVDLNQHVADLQVTAPEIEAGTKNDSTGIGSADWGRALDAIATTCSAADAELTIQGFTGG